MSTPTELVTIEIDGKSMQVPKGANIIDVAREAGIEIPHYCYHPCLSVAGNCRMCQVEVEGAPKLSIACNMTATEGLKVHTQHTSPEVKESQRAILEFLLINHPLDCTVCDQAGHCKLQDYYYDYNAQPSRFVESKVHKVKAEVLGPNVVYDGERCIVCTRCVRFCDEVTKTSELGVYNRGDHSVVAISPDRPLDNPLSGCVVDLCPVGALTHRPWRFNTRIWYTKLHDSVCPGCSTGCNMRAAVRDGQVVHVKARLNTEVNAEWMCDEGRYGFDRFNTTERLQTPVVSTQGRMESVSFDVAVKSAAKLAGTSDADTAVFLSPMLTLEEMWTALRFAESVMGVRPSSERVAVALRSRSLSTVEQVLVSPDYAPNARAAELLKLTVVSEDWRKSLEERYEQLLVRLASQTVKRLLVVGDFALLADDLKESHLQGIAGCDVSVALVTRPGLAFRLSSPRRAESDGVLAPFSVYLPAQMALEKNGIYVNRDLRAQRLRSLMLAPSGALPEWGLLAAIAKSCGKELLPSVVHDERSLFSHVAGHLPELSGLTLTQIGDRGVSLVNRGTQSPGSQPNGQANAQK